MSRRRFERPKSLPGHSKRHRDIQNETVDVPDDVSGLPEEVLNIRNLIANVPNEVWKERLRLDQDFFERFAHGEMQSFSGWDIHHPAGFRVLCRSRPTGANGKAAKATDLHPPAIGQCLGDFIQDDIKSLGNILLVVFIELPGSLAYQFTLEHDDFQSFVMRGRGVASLDR